jgi:hypothetical protein
MQSTSGGTVKIGFAENVELRRAQLEYYYGRPLSLLATLPGGRDEERAIHKRFESLRVGRTEQFLPGPELMAFIGRPLFVNQGNVILMVPTVKGGPVRLTDEALKWARIASGYTGQSMAEYVSQFVAEHARLDAERLHAEVTKKEKGKP